MRLSLPCLLTLALLAPGPAAAQEPAATEARKRSVLFCLIDTCRADRIGAYGHERETTPFLDEIARRGVVFERCYSQGPWTKPSMAALLTSRYPTETGMFRLFQRLPDHYVTFPEALSSAGWHTAGWSANPIMGGFSGYRQGFTEFVESVQVNRGDPIRFASGSARKLNEFVLPWVEKNDRWPLFLYVHSVDPHEEYAPDEEYLKQFADPEAVHGYRADWNALLGTRPAVPGNHVTAWNFAEADVEPDPFIEMGLDLYDADLRANDDELERLWEKLQENGWGDDVVFVLTSDHGEEFFEHGGTSHGYSLYKELLHVPLILYAPGLLPEGRRVSEPVRSIDIYPTLLDLLDVEAPTNLSGRSLLPLIHGEESGPAFPIFSEKIEDEGGRQAGSGAGVALSVIDRDWKFILNLREAQNRESPRHELYDLSVDPLELHNLAGQFGDRVVAYEQMLLERVAQNFGHRSVTEHVDAEAIDPAILEELEALGYTGSDEEEEFLAEEEDELPAIGDRMPSIARAVLEATGKWELFALEPEGEAREGARSFHGHPIRGRETVEGEELAGLRHEIYRGIAESDGRRARCFLPRHGVRAQYRGLSVDLVICYECFHMRVFLADAQIGVAQTSDVVEPAVTKWFEAVGLEIAD